MNRHTERPARTAAMGALLAAIVAAASESAACYETDMAPGVHTGDGVVSLVGTNGRRVLVARMPEGLYVGGVLLDKDTVFATSATLLALWRRMEGGGTDE
jgi:hypothetical protein